MRAERAGDRARGAKAEAAANRERRQRERETARGEAAGKIEKLAARMKLDLAANLRDTRKAETLREEWRRPNDAEFHAHPSDETNLVMKGGRH